MTTLMHWSPFTRKFHLHHHHMGVLLREAGGHCAVPEPRWLHRNFDPEMRRREELPAPQAGSLCRR